MAGPRVLIVGAGLAGLGAALSLKQSGVEDVTVFEQANRLEDIQLGNGMIIWPNSVKALQELGVEQKLTEFANSVRTVEVFDPKGRLLSTWDMSDIQQRVGAGTRCFVRGELHKLLTTALGRSTPTRSSSGSGSSGSTRTPRASASRSRTAAWSAATSSSARTACFRRPGDSSPGSGGPSSRPTSTRRGTASSRSPIARRFRTAPSTWCSGQGFGSTSIEPRTRASATAATGGCSATSPSASPIPEGSKPSWARCSPDTCHRSAISSPRLPKKRSGATSSTAGRPCRAGRGRITLLGDAAHAMTNTLGQGAGMAFEDAIVLGRALSSSLGPVEALRAFQERRMARTDSAFELISKLSSTSRAGDEGQGVVPQQRQDPHWFQEGARLGLRAVAGGRRPAVRAVLIRAGRPSRRRPSRRTSTCWSRSRAASRAGPA